MRTKNMKIWKQQMKFSLRVTGKDKYQEQSHKREDGGRRFQWQAAGGKTMIWWAQLKHTEGAWASLEISRREPGAICISKLHLVHKDLA